MVNFIARQIENAANVSLESGQEKYKEYFINITLYSKYKDAVDEKLIADGYLKVIPVTE